MSDLGMEAASEERIRDSVGLGLREAVEAVCPGVDDADFARVVERYRQHWVNAYRDKPTLFEGAAATLARLRQEGYWLGVATGKGRQGLDRDLGQTGVAEYFVVTRTVDEAPSKPHPQMLLDILEALGCSRNEALMVGDTTHDLGMAQNAGVSAAAVLTGSHSPRLFETFQPLVVLESVAGLPQWLATRYEPPARA